MKLALLALTVTSAGAATIGGSRIGLSANDHTCAISRPVTRVEAATEQIFYGFEARGVHKGDRLTIEWINPRGEVHTSVPYEELPSASSVCLITSLPIGGMAPASQPGQWHARTILNGRVADEKSFEIVGQAAPISVKVVRVSEGELLLETFGADGETTVNVARYTPAGGWIYVAHALPETAEGGRARISLPKLEPAEYIVLLRRNDGVQSLPARFLIASKTGYRMPGLSAERWRVTQGPLGSYSHWGRASQAWDLAPTGSRLVTAMRAGVVHARDLGLGQTPKLRIFGNYVTIQHDDGEFSHYAHLRTGTFRVKTGQRVEAGDVLAEAGTSGYSFGVHLHVQVTKAFAIASQSVPFRFSAESEPATVLSQRRPDPVKVKPTRLLGEVPFSEWWTRLLPVPRGARALQVQVGWENRDNEFELYVVSPSGRTFRDDGKVVKIDTPEAGTWRISVQAVRGSGPALPFWVEPEVAKSK